MSQQRKTPVTALSLPVVLRDQINLVALELSAQLGRRISMAAVVGAALEVAKRHSDELADVLTPDSTGEPK